MRKTVNEPVRSTHVQTYLPLAAVAACVWAVVGSAAFKWPGTESPQFLSNRARLERMTPEQRHKLWDKYQEFLSLPPAEQDRIRRLNSDLQKQPPDKRERYRALMDQYKKWKDSLPLVQRQQLEDAATQGSNALYGMIRDVEKQKEFDDSRRPYWYLPDNPGVRKAVPKILGKLSAEEIEQLDQTSPLDRPAKLFSYAQQFDMDAPKLPGGARQTLPGRLPPPDPDKFREFIRKLSREQLEDLSDLGMVKTMRERGLRDLYYKAHPDELRERLRRGEGGPMPSFPPNRPPDREPKESETKPPPAETKEPAKQGGNLGIPRSNP